MNEGAPSSQGRDSIPDKRARGNRVPNCKPVHRWVMGVLGVVVSCVLLLLPASTAWASPFTRSPEASTAARVASRSSAALPHSIEARTVVLPCVATLRRFIVEALFSGKSGVLRLHAVGKAQPGDLLSPGGGAPTPQDAAIASGDAKSTRDMCGFVTTSYIAGELALIGGILNFGLDGHGGITKKLQSMTPAQRAAIENALITGSLTNPSALAGLGLGGPAPHPQVVTQVVTKVKITKSSPDRVVMDVTSRETVTESVDGHKQTITATDTADGIGARKIGTRWFLTTGSTSGGAVVGAGG